ncbi:antirepressor [Clostridia bacterium]|nr:antirepressor [Clostridia bacterium]
MDNVKVFENAEFGKVRTVEIDGEPWFVGRDVAEILGYKNPNEAVREHCKGVSETLTPTNGGNQSVKIIQERDVYRLVMRSALPKAEEFENWVVGEVLPSIRKHGMYATNELLDNPEHLLAVTLKLVDERKARLRAETEKAELEKQVEKDKPKVLFADAVASSSTTILIGELAKILKQNGVDIGQNRLFEWLRVHGYLISRKGTDFNMPTQRAMEMGLFWIKETSITHADGHTTVSKTPKVTGRGQTYFVNVFLNKNNEIGVAS